MKEGAKDAPSLCGWEFKIRTLTNSTKTRRKRERHLIPCSSPGFEILLFCACLSSAAFEKQLPEPIAARRFVRLRVLVYCIGVCVCIFVYTRVCVRALLATKRNSLSWRVLAGLVLPTTPFDHLLAFQTVRLGR